MAVAKKEFYFHLYFHEISDGAGKTTMQPIKPNPNLDFPYFGEISIMDVPLLDKLSGGKTIARAQGVSIQSDQNAPARHMSFNISFEIPELKGSTLQVMGRALELTTVREWTIVGGTGMFTLAQGVVYGRRLSSDEIWIELKLHGYYTPMQKPSWKKL